MLIILAFFIENCLTHHCLIHLLHKLLACRCDGAQHSISYDTAADQWSISSVALPSGQSLAFHFVSQLLDQVDVGLEMVAADIRSVAARFPLYGMYSAVPSTSELY